MSQCPTTFRFPCIKAESGEAGLTAEQLAAIIALYLTNILDASEIDNDSEVSGNTVADALNTLNNSSTATLTTTDNAYNNIITFPVALGETITYRALLSAVDTNNSEGAWGECIGGAYNKAATITNIGSSISLNFGAAFANGNADFKINLNDATDEIELQVKGDIGVNVIWNIRVFTVNTVTP